MIINKLQLRKNSRKSNNDWVRRMISLFFLSLFLFSQTALAFQINKESKKFGSEKTYSKGNKQSVLNSDIFDLLGNSRDFEFKDSDKPIENDLEEKSGSENKSLSAAYIKVRFDHANELISASQFSLNFKQKKKSIPFYITHKSWKSFIN